MSRQQDSRKFSRDLDRHIEGEPEDEGDYMQDALDENWLRRMLQDMVEGNIDTEEFAEQASVTRVESFEDAGVLTSDEGFRFRLQDGRVGYVTVKIQSR